MIDLKFNGKVTNNKIKTLNICLESKNSMKFIYFFGYGLDEWE